jgi:hypothetical protein
MPNWCNNSATFYHTDPDQVTRLAKAFNEDRLFSEFFPCPEELKAVEARGGASLEEAATKEKYGYDSWYDWNLAHWGTKWDAGAGDLGPIVMTEGKAAEVSVSFDTAWSPPIEFYDNMEELGWSIIAYYYEPGMAFCGKYDTELGGDEEYSIDGDDSDWVCANIPTEIDEAFGISENMDMWAEEEPPALDANQTETK